MNHDYNINGGGASYELNLEAIQQRNRAAAYHYSRNTVTNASTPASGPVTTATPSSTTTTTANTIIHQGHPSALGSSIPLPFHLHNTHSRFPQPHQQQAIMTNARNSWPPVSLDMGAGVPRNSNPSSPEAHQTSPPLSQSSSPHSHYSSIQHSPLQQAAGSNPLTDWALQQHQQFAQQQHMNTADMSHFMQDPAVMGFNNFPGHFQPTPLEYLPPSTTAALQASLLGPAFAMPQGLDEANMQWGNAGLDGWQDLQGNLNAEGMPRMDSVGSNSPTGTYLEVLSLPSSSGDGWAMVDWGNPDFQAAQTAAIFNPSQTLHLRTNSDSSEG